MKSKSIRTISGVIGSVITIGILVGLFVVLYFIHPPGASDFHGALKKHYESTNFSLKGLHDIGYITFNDKAIYLYQITSHDEPYIFISDLKVKKDLVRNITLSIKFMVIL